ncbi:PREDICTED: ubiquitin-conjugating enzyme E2 25 isoform X1 [Rhagoletis zephyria]|uniref:ubiquitin-conjugating enzyme E2 25 isoform X1 n=1 Tax=Rhagoletis zephyria TaxID=28612 RepID=UPI00081135B0|nr:PREDICTED: ubiquitin-conjugating enzyme E2 25 isoform X1 [Rhagoletis zephyria]XP_017475022.1 PREDICTED: ubiquitin-conjugating enzyme E2 25 isoform X1 [Rhagoletis zephyria]XP_017475023.1 PREDICTED: ubiquitin-conjugating enzyme E2 25 isoform X1 [Rhagoletis zephyria]XP_017475024.1 PREDICTED: ubiquitin-conjugating enzyme E2 25 isoform X1 [Rhagoletis zephyria]
MACLNTLKLEIKTLEKIFNKNHERFQILNSSVDELTCRFIGKNGKRYDIHANITSSCYMWQVQVLLKYLSNSTIFKSDCRSSYEAARNTLLVK